ncbi:MAG: hypothetical protein AAB408_03095 [Patescibacteria group bacterium]
MSILPFLIKERFASIREIQRNPSKTLRQVTRVIRGSKTIGVFFSNEELEELMENFEASRSKRLRARTRRARRSMKSGALSGRPLVEVFRKYGI